MGMRLETGVCWGLTNLPTGTGQVQMQLQLGLELEHFCELFSHYEQIGFIVKRLGNGRQRSQRSLPVRGE